MTEPNNDTQGKRTSAQTARRTADKATGGGAQAAKSVASAADEAASAARTGARRPAEVASGAAQTAAKGVEAGRRVLATVPGRVTTTAQTAWTVIAHRKLVAAGAAAGVTALSAASYAVGRRSARRTLGPLTRLTGGRI
nr:hypothetical protein [Streptomyces cyaneogriseus]